MEPSNINSNPTDVQPALTEFSKVKLTFLEQHNISPILFAFISLIILFGTYQIVGGVITLLVFGAQITPQNVNGIRWLTMFGQLVFLLLPTLILAKLATFKSTEFLRLNKVSFLQSVLAVVGIFSLQQILQVYMVFQDKIPIPQSIQPYLDQMKHMMEEAYKLLAGSSSFPEMFFVVAVVALVPAFSEEILFRGLVQRNLEKSLNTTKGVIITGIVFGAFHLNPFSLVPLAAIGIYLGFLTAKSNSIFSSITAHFFNNFIAILALRFGYGDDDLITGKAAALSAEELSITFFASAVVFVLSIYYFIRVSEKKLNLYKEE
jgi:membrane protease YdiL (CAAX protease family)